MVRPDTLPVTTTVTDHLALDSLAVEGDNSLSISSFRFPLIPSNETSHRNASVSVTQIVPLAFPLEQGRCQDRGTPGGTSRSQPRGGLDVRASTNRRNSRAWIRKAPRSRTWRGFPQLPFSCRLDSRRQQL